MDVKQAAQKCYPPARAHQPDRTSKRAQRPAAKVAAKRADADRLQPTSAEQKTRAERCADTHRHPKSAYGSEGWGFESLRARKVPGQSTCVPGCPGRV